MKSGKVFFVFALCLIFFGAQAEESNVQTGHNDVYVPPQPHSEPFDLKTFFLTNFTDPNKYMIELILVGFALIYTLNYFVGKRLNEKYALLWVQENRSLFENEFAHIGVSNIQGGALLDAESANSFKFYATGRLNIISLLASIELKKRQDLLSMFIFNFIWPEKDRLKIEIPIDTPVPLPFILAIAKRREAKNLQQNNPEIKKFCRKIPCEEIAKQYTVLGENDETSDYILTGPVISALKKCDGVIESLSFTDLKQPNKQFLKAELVLNNALLANPKDLQPLLKTLFNLADYITHYKMSSNCRTTAEKERQAYEAAKAKENLKEKNEEIQKKLQEKKKEEAGNKKKDDKKEELRQKKKMQRKFVKMV